MPVAERDRVELYYERSGNGDLELLFVHGWCCDRTFFQPQVDHFAQSCSVTVVDLRGCGHSGRADDGYDIPSLADDLAAVCAHAGIARPVVVGHSLGGMIGVELAARHPSLTRAVVAVDPGPIAPRSTGPTARPCTVRTSRGSRGRPATTHSAAGSSTRCARYRSLSPPR